MKSLFTIAQVGMIVLLVLTSPSLALASDSQPKDSGPQLQADFLRWRGTDGDFANWTLDGVGLVSFAMPGQPTIGPEFVLDPATAKPGTDTPGAYYGRNFYNGGDYWVGEATSPEITTKFAFQEAIASWDAATPPGTWIETQARARFGERWTKWYNLGVWASDTGTVARHSVSLQGDNDAFVSVDTLVMAKGKVAPDGLQLKVRLFSATSGQSPVVTSMSLAYSTGAPKKVTPSTGDSTRWNTLLAVPECSQMVYPDGGNVWCSPTSVSMVLGYWGIDPGPCEQRVRKAVDGVYDWRYDGHGNWPFNTAYAASRGMEAYVRRYTSLNDLEPWLQAGVPVVMSIAWGKGDLTGAAIPASSGHLVVLVGFDAQGNPIVNDPAAAADADVQRTYIRSEFESVWLLNSAGTVYLIYPHGHPVPGF